MTADQKLKKLLAAGESMRKIQIAYRNERSGKDGKLSTRKPLLLRDVAEKEAAFDQLLREYRQLTLFA